MNLKYEVFHPKNFIVAVYHYSKKNAILQNSSIKRFFVKILCYYTKICLDIVSPLSSYNCIATMVLATINPTFGLNLQLITLSLYPEESLPYVLSRSVWASILLASYIAHLSPYRTPIPFLPLSANLFCSIIVHNFSKRTNLALSRSRKSKIQPHENTKK